MFALDWFARSRSFGSSAGALALIAGAWSGSLFAAEATLSKSEKQDRKAVAESFLDEALIAEVDGRSEDRAALLAKAEALAPDLPAIQWQRGMVLVDDKWMPAEDVAVSSEGRALLEEYLAKRDAAESSPNAQFALSKWCQERKLFAQERAHLTRVLAFDPNHETARARLGFVRLGDAWVGREEIARATAEEAKTQAALKKHAGSLHDILRSLSDDNRAARARVLERVRALRDAEMIPALERLVAGIDEEAARAVLQALSAMPEKEASLALARLAVASPSLEVRGEATRLLKERPFDQYVPELLASMTGSLRSEWTVARGRGGQLFLRQATYVETMPSIDVAVQETGYVAYDATTLGAPGRGEAIVLAGAAATAANRDAEARAALTLAFEKVRQAERFEVNARVGEVLDSVTEQKLGADAEQWWNWWNQHNELVIPDGKPVRVKYASQTVDIPLARQALAQVQSGRVLVHDKTPTSCFAAGTPVLTNRGDVAIEQMRVGDLVLAQNVETGELAFKPVLETTVRPPAEILKIEYEGGSLRATGGHPFWVSGQGWVHARRLESGMELHTPTGTVRVSDVVSDGVEPAYNLIVADFANYFVSEARILSHDNSSRMPTDAIVPGLAQR